MSVTSHIFVGGISFSGSTLMNLCLGSLPGAASANETNWLVPQPGRAMADFSFGEEPAPACRLCGAYCSHHDRAFRESLQRNPSGWAARIADRLGAKVLVTGEKEMTYLQALYADAPPHILVVFRHPVRHWRSFAKRPWKDTTPRQFMQRWILQYSSLSSEPAPGGRTFLELETFQRHPERTMKALCGRLGLEYDSSFQEYWMHPHHYVGGNFSVAERLRDAPEKLPIQTPPKFQPNASEVQMLNSEPEAMRLYRRLQRRAVKPLSMLSGALGFRLGD